MSKKKPSQRSPQKPSESRKHRVPILVAVIGALATILVAGINLLPAIWERLDNEETALPTATVHAEIIAPSASLTPLPTSTAVSSTLIFNPVADASIKRHEPTTNFGSEVTLAVDKDPEESFLLAFNVAGVEGTVTKTILRLYSIDDADFGGNFYRIVDNNWSEISVTYDTSPQYDSSAIIESIGAVTVNRWYDVDLTSLVIGNGTYGFRIESPSTNGADYNSRESANPPQLVVTFTTATDSIQRVISKVNSSVDDAEEYVEDNSAGSKGYMDIESSDLELTFEYGPQVVGMRFTGIMIPQGATITNAYIEFEVDETTSGETYMTFRAEASDNASAFTSVNGDISARARTMAEVHWQKVPGWTVSDVKWQTPNIANVIQEIVKRPGWYSGNSIVIIINGEGTRIAKSFDGNPDAAPVLVITYMP